ncbi:MAG: DUF1732 domain-containing protein, partial [Verrucomicrobia bacterium]|nr:DUF1732 domain-containing protein [Cytophagales bacterium]
MLKSMTGFGAGQAENEYYLLNTELRCVNSKFLDVSMRLPRNLSDKELEIRNLLNPLERGKINLQIDIQSKSEAKPQSSINKALLKSYFELLSETAVELETSSQDIFRLALQMPEVIQVNTNDDEKEMLLALLQKSIGQAITACEGFRKAEGKSLEAKFVAYIEKIQNLLKAIENQDPQRSIAIRNRLQAKLTDIRNDEKFDENRFEQEMIYYLEKLDIAEEKVRLATHLSYFLEVMTKEENQGRKLNFISQEIG